MNYPDFEKFSLLKNSETTTKADTMNDIMNDIYILLKDYSTPHLFLPKGTIFEEIGNDMFADPNRSKCFSIGEVTHNTHFFQKVTPPAKEYTLDDMHECWLRAQKVITLSWTTPWHMPGRTFDDYIKSKNQGK